MYPIDEKQEFPSKSSSNTQSAVISVGTANSNSSAELSGSYQHTNTIVNRSTPILYSTNRGLYLRLAKPIPSTSQEDTMAAASSTRRSHCLRASTYDTRFCDLERWSTNRANSVCLEDTIVASRTFTISQFTTRRSLAPATYQRPSCTSFPKF